MNNMMGGPPPGKQGMYGNQMPPQRNPGHYQQQYAPGMKRPYPGHPGPQNFPVQVRLVITFKDKFVLQI